VAYDEAFNFYYPENLELLEEQGAEIVPFSPLEDAAIPADIGGVYLGGGFPEVFAEPLARNHSMAESLQRANRSGMPIYAECGGLMFLSRSLQTEAGVRHRMVGLVPVDVEMDGQVHRFGYRQILTLADSLLSPKGQFFRGHEFHWSRIRNQDPQRQPRLPDEQCRGRPDRLRRRAGAKPAGPATCICILARTRCWWKSS